MNTKSTKIIVIHDGLIPKIDPLLISLKEHFGADNTIHFVNSNEGLDYINNNLNQRMIVLLDINFSKNELSGIEVFKDIRKKTSLVYVILVTADEYNKIKNEDLVFLINHDAFALESVTTDYEKIISLVVKASHKLDTRVDSALEQWIVLHPEQERNIPYILTRDGRSYTLNDILAEIRLQTEFGMETEKNILMLTIDMLARGKKNLNG